LRGVLRFVRSTDVVELSPLAMLFIYLAVTLIMIIRGSM